MKGSRNPEEEVQGRTNTEKHRFSWQMKRCLSVCSVIPVALLLFIMLSGDAVAYERIVVLYASASPIIRELGAGGRVVGVTRTDHTFKGAKPVGSHLRPNIELIKSLQPDLIVAGSKRAFPDELKKAIGVDVFHYDPRTLDEIITRILQLGKTLGKDREAEALVGRLNAKLKRIKPVKKRPRVIYEVMYRPLKVAGAKSIVASIIERAGGMNIVGTEKKHVTISPERILKDPPDIYIYQVGPMNKNPIPPRERSYFHGLKSRFFKVDEYEFARPGLNVFDAVIELNGIFREVTR